MKIFVNALLTLALVTLLAACGGGGGGGGSAPAGPPAVSGTASKGIIKNGVVSIYGVTAGVTDSEPLVTGATDSNGEYSLQLPSYSGPIVIEITSDGNSTMTCDVVDGCGEGFVFGDDYPLSNDFSLKAVVPSTPAGKTITTNITTLTTMAAAFAEADGNVDAQVIQDANSQVASLFNITGDITEIDVVDITDPEALAAAGSQTQKIATLGPAILSASLSDETNVEQAIKGFVEEFANNQGQIIENGSAQSDAVSLTDILTAQTALLDSQAFSDVELGALKTTSTLSLEKAQQAVPDALTTSAPTTPADVKAVQAAANLVNQVRRLGLASTYTDSDEIEFIDEFDRAASLIEDDAAVDLLDTLDLAVVAVDGALRQVWLAQDEGNTPPTTYTDPDSGLTVNIDKNVYTIEGGTIGDTTVDLEARLKVEDSYKETSESDGTIVDYSETFDADLDLKGMIKNTDMSLTIDQGFAGSYVGGDKCTYYEDDYYEDDYYYCYEGYEDYDLGPLKLNGTFTQLGVESPISFNGKLEVDITRLKSTFSEETAQQEWPSDPASADFCEPVSGSDVVKCLIDENVYEEQITFKEVEIILSGEFSQDDKSFKATFNADINNPRGYVSKTTEEFRWYAFFDDVSNNPSYNFEEVIDGPAEQTKENWIAMALGLAFEFDLKGVDDNAALRIVAERTGLETVEAELTVDFDGERLTAASNSEDETVVVTDQNGNSLTLREDANDGLQGEIRVDGEVKASIGEESEVVIIRYNDGSFETF